MTIVVAQGDAAHAYLPMLREWMEGEWGSVDPFDAEGIPSPQVALVEQTLIGGLVFTTAPRPGTSTSCVWVNALFVAPEHRGRGAASLLIRAAVQAVRVLGIEELFVLTDVPALYLKCGWTPVVKDTDSGEQVLQLQI